MSLLPQLLGFAASLCYAACFVFARRAVHYSNAATIAITAFCIQIVVLAPIAFLKVGLPEVSTVAVVCFVIVGLILAVVQLLSFTGVAKIGAARASALRGTFPLFSVVIAIMFLDEPATLSVLAGTILVVSGIILISWQPKEATGNLRWWYALIPLGAAFLAGVMHPIRRYALTLANYPILFVVLVAAVALMAVLAFLPFLPRGQRPMWRHQGLAAVVAAGAFQSAGFLLINFALGFGPVVHVIPIIASFPAWVLLGTVFFMRNVEKIDLRAGTGTLLTIVGTIVILLS